MENILISYHQLLDVDRNKVIFNLRNGKPNLKAKKITAEECGKLVRWLKFWEEGIQEFLNETSEHQEKVTV